MAGLGGRLLDSARADPSAVSFQVRPVDVVVSSGPRPIAEARQTSFTNFGSLETIQQVRSLGRRTLNVEYKRRCGA